MRQRSIVIAAVAVAFLLCLAVQPGLAADVQATPTISYADFSAVDAALAARGIKARLYVAEYTTRPDSGQYGGTVFARNVGNKQLSAHWVPSDPRRRNGRVITYAIDGVDLSATGGPAGNPLVAAIDRAMGTWNGRGLLDHPARRGSEMAECRPRLSCSTALGTRRTSPAGCADITHAGWLGPAFFEPLFAEATRTYVIGVTFTYVLGDRKTGAPPTSTATASSDVAFREIYYNNDFLWSLDGPAWYDPEIDVETIVLHETGHGLSQGHFGKMFVDASDKEPPYSVSHLHFSPRAVMNAVYWDTQRSLLGSDVGGHCSIWAAWPLK